MKRLAVLVLLFVSSLAWLVFLTTQIPDAMLSAGQRQILTRFPANLDDLKRQAGVLSIIAADNGGMAYVAVLFSSVYVFKQTFAIPGSVFLNILAGAVFGFVPGYAAVCLLTAIGATSCFLVARYVGRQAVIRNFPDRMRKFSAMLEENSSRLPYFLVSMRMLFVTPNWAVNVCCGVLDVPVTTFFLTVLVGLAPYNYICVTAGVLLSKLTSTSDLLSWTSVLQLTGIALMALLPALVVKKETAKSHDR